MSVQTTVLRCAGGLACVAGLLATTATAQPPGISRPTVQNIALDRPYTLFPSPTYQHCTDAGDATQLTDGKTTSEYFWTQQGTVGWQHVQFATVTVDLGKVEPISGVSMTTAAGVANVTWPMAVYVLVSDDGKTFHEAGDLVALYRADTRPWPDGYAIRRLVTDKLDASGRYVQFVIIPLSGGPYLFTDEVEVFRGPKALLQRRPHAGEPTDARSIYEKGRIQRAVQHRWAEDATGLEELIGATDLDEPAQAEQRKRLAQTRSLGPDSIDADASFRTILPMGKHHAELLKVQAGLWKAMGREELSVWVADTWAPLELFTLPPKTDTGQIRVDVMRGEYRAAALNLANSTDGPMDVRLRFEGLPGAPTPSYVTLHDVPWTDTSQGVPIAAALPEANREGNAWKITVLPGLTRQVWMTFHVTEQQAGEYVGAIVVESGATELRKLPVELQVWPLEFPQETTLRLGGWSYTNGGGTYGVTSQNRAAFLAHLQEHFVNAPWANSGVLRSYQFDKQDPTKIQLDTRSLDEWIERWPNAKAYMVFLSVAHYSGSVRTSLAGAEIGTAEFNQRVGTWISGWVRHLRSKGIEPNRLGLLIHDEPHEGSDIAPFLAWARAIRAVEPDVIIWEDPTYRDPTAAPAELFDACDVLCPNRPMWLERGDRFAQFYRRQQADGRTLQFYSCSGPTKLLDPYSYYRLQAWQCCDVGGTGSFFWAFGDNSGASSWNEYFAKTGPYTPLFLDDTSVTAGKHMEAIRESVEDFEYFVMLRKAVERAKKAGRADAALAQAEELLQNGVREVLEADSADQLRWHEPKDRTVADRMRVRILEALVALR